MRRPGLLASSLLALLLTVGMGVLVWHAINLSSVSHISDQIERLKPFAGAVRLALFGLLAASWPGMVELAHRSGRIDQNKRDRLLAQRWRIVAWLLVIELVLGHNLFGRLFAATTGTLV